jgi:hypothetical protein
VCTGEEGGKRECGGSPSYLQLRPLCVRHGVSLPCLRQLALRHRELLLRARINEIMIAMGWKYPTFPLMICAVLIMHRPIMAAESIGSCLRVFAHCDPIAGGHAGALTPEVAGGAMQGPAVQYM